MVEPEKSLWRSIQSTYRTSLKPWLTDKKWYILVGIGVIVFLVGCYGFDEGYHGDKGPRYLLEIAYLSVQLFVLQSGTVVSPVGYALQFARFAAPAVTILAFMAFFASLFLDHLKRYLLGLIGGHVVICGLGYIGPVIAENFYRSGYHVVVIENDPENKNIDRCKDNGPLVILGDATKRDTLKKAHVGSAKYVFCVTGDDGLNADISVMCHELVKASRRRKPLKCFVHMTDHKLCSLLSEKSRGKNDGNFHLKFFNIYQTAGKSIMKYYPPVDLSSKIPLDNNILIVGIGRMGENLLLQTAKKWRSTYGSPEKKLRFTILDRNAKDKKESLYLRYPFLKDVCDIDHNNIELQSYRFLKGDYLFNEAGICDVTRVYICLDNERLGLSTALQLTDLLRKIPAEKLTLKDHPVPVIVRTIRCGGITKLLNELKISNSEYSNISGFPIIDVACGKEIILSDVEEFIARAIHQEYVAAEELKDNTPATNPSMVPWDDLMEELKESNLQQAEHIWTKMDDISCAISIVTGDEPLFEFEPGEIEFLAKKEHERWCDEKTKKGWVYGPIRDNPRRIHPDLQLWEKLSEETREKDRNAIRTLPRTLEKADLRIVRLGEKRQKPAEKLLMPEVLCKVSS